VVVENHREHAHGLPDRLLPEPGLGELGDEPGDVARLKAGAGDVAEAREQPAEHDLVGGHRSLADVDASGLPGLGELAEGRRLLRLALAEDA
jgi:hypothetical protein